jgi:hypothetical protein
MPVRSVTYWGCNVETVLLSLMVDAPHSSIHEKTNGKDIPVHGMRAA